MIVYIKNIEELENDSNQTSIPLIWMWTNLSSGTVGWTAATYLSNFLLYFTISVGETVAWMFYLFGMPEWFSWWVNLVGFYGIFLGIFPNLFAAFQLWLSPPEGGFAGNSSVEFGNNSVFLLSGGLIVWL